MLGEIVSNCHKRSRTLALFLEKDVLIFVWSVVVAADLVSQAKTARTKESFVAFNDIRLTSCLAVYGNMRERPSDA